MRLFFIGFEGSRLYIASIRLRYIEALARLNVQIMQVKLNRYERVFDIFTKFQTLQK